MVWKLRSKTAFIYENGLNRYIQPKFKDIPYENFNEVPAICAKSDMYSQQRIIHNYRNMSRASKQFLLGDPIAEQLVLNMLRHEFLFIKNNIQTPIFNYSPMVSFQSYFIIYCLIIII